MAGLEELNPNLRIPILVWMYKFSSDYALSWLNLLAISSELTREQRFKAASSSFALKPTSVSATKLSMAAESILNSDCDGTVKDLAGVAIVNVYESGKANDGDRESILEFLWSVFDEDTPNTDGARIAKTILDCMDGNWGSFNYPIDRRAKDQKTIVEYLLRCIANKTSPKLANNLVTYLMIKLSSNSNIETLDRTPEEMMSDGLLRFIIDSSFFYASDPYEMNTDSRMLALKNISYAYAAFGGTPSIREMINKKLEKVEIDNWSAEELLAVKLFFAYHEITILSPERDTNEILTPSVQASFVRAMDIFESIRVSIEKDNGVNLSDVRECLKKIGRDFEGTNAWNDFIKACTEQIPGLDKLLNSFICIPGFGLNEIKVDLSNRLQVV